jgi:hypothetical protein
MAARKQQKDDPDTPVEETEVEAPEAAPFADEVHARGGWDLGYRGDRTDPVPDEAYTVTGVTAPQETSADES